MADALVSFSSPGQILYLFGTQDRHLRQLRETLGVEVTLRGDEIRLHGTDDQIKRGLAVFAELRQILEEQGGLPETALDDALAHHARPDRIIRHDVPVPLFEDTVDESESQRQSLLDKFSTSSSSSLTPASRDAGERVAVRAAVPAPAFQKTNGHHGDNGHPSHSSTSSTSTLNFFYIMTLPFVDKNVLTNLI